MLSSEFPPPCILYGVKTGLMQPEGGSRMCSGKDKSHSLSQVLATCREPGLRTDSQGETILG